MAPALPFRVCSHRPLDPILASSEAVIPFASPAGHIYRGGFFSQRVRARLWKLYTVHGDKACIGAFSVLFLAKCWDFGGAGVQEIDLSDFASYEYTAMAETDC